MINQFLVNSERARCPPRLAWTGFHPARSTWAGRLRRRCAPSPSSPTFPIPQTNRWDLVYAMLLRESASIPKILSRLPEGNGNRTSRGTAIPARTRGWRTLFTDARRCPGPRPNCPRSYAPHTKTRPSLRRNTEWNSPHAMSATREPATIGLPLLIVDTRHGVWMISLYPPSPM